MATYVLLTRLPPESVHDTAVRKTKGKEWMAKVQSACPEVRWLGHYSLLGPYDFMDLYEAPSEEVAHRVAMISRAEGAWTVETWSALPYDRFLKSLGQVEG